MTWKQWMIQVGVTIVLSAFAAAAGMNVGLVRSQEQIIAVQAAQMTLTQRLDRIETKLDRVIERTYVLKEHP